MHSSLLIFRRPSRRSLSCLALTGGALLLAGCGTFGQHQPAYEPENFDSSTTHTRTYEATQAQTCEAARRALLSQGYQLTTANADLVTGHKNFQPAEDMHVGVELRVVCARDGSPGGGTIAFATAQQDRYTLKKTNNSASVGVGVIGSLSLPFSASADALVKVASETLTDERFYDRFFALIERFLTPALDEPGATAPRSAPPATTFPVPSSPDRG